MTRNLGSLVRALALGVPLILATSAGAQQGYPNKPVRLIAPYPPGGGISTAARLIGQKLPEGWGHQVIVDNRGGGNTIIGTEAMVKSPPDGYTLLMVASTHVINPLLLSNLPYDTIRDFAPVATVASNEQLLVAHQAVPANSLAELITLAKSRRGLLNYASTGNGGVRHLAGEFFNGLAGVAIHHIPYKGGGPAITDLIGGQVQLLFATPTAVIPHVRSGKLKAIAISGPGRFSGLPQVPTFAEAGLPAFELKTWYGILAPAATPKAIVEKLSGDIARILGP